MNTVTSRDGTPIAYERSGDGPPLILVDGALCSRAMGTSRPLAKLLAERFTVYAYDRRGRNESGDTAPYDVAREVEDLEALIAEAGGEAHVYGISSGAALALEAARRGAPITSLVLYEAPFVVDDSRPPVPADLVGTLEADLAAGRGGAAVKAFMREVGVPGIGIALMRVLPVWRKLTSVAHTLPYDFAILEGLQSGRPLPAGRWDDVTVPALVVVGGKSPAWFHNSMRSLADALPNARHEVLDGQNHMVKPKALAPLLTEFFGGEAQSSRKPAGGSESAVRYAVS
jgi:pimeloyl-ACP methyl ester carboxylesterase